MSSKLQKVFVGISGGVDSATSAAILKRDGYDVTGVFIKIWSPEWTRCSMQEDRRDAMRVCAALDIPFREIDCTEEYKREVIDPMIEAYKRGDVPNPDVLCNRYVKFGTFFDYAMNEGADFVATGHYAQIKRITATNSTTKDVYQLQVSKDAEKDQTYFLWMLTQRELAKTLFPIGHLKKDEVRAVAKKLSVPVADKKDSQGLCFLGSYGVDEFLSTYITPKQGFVLNEGGEIIGTHGGVHFLTVGSRHGFTINKQGTHARPLYIKSKQVADNTITVSENKTDEAGCKIIVNNINWSLGFFSEATTFDVRPYHRAPLMSVSVEVLKNNDISLTFKERRPALSTGQSIIFYKNGVCLGGGILSKTL